MREDGERISAGARIHRAFDAPVAFGVYALVFGHGEHILHHCRDMKVERLVDAAEVIAELEVVHLEERGILDIVVGCVLATLEVGVEEAGREVVDLTGVP